MWFIYAALGAIVTGVGQVFVKKGQAKLTPLLDNILATLVVNLILVPFLLFWGINITLSRDILIYSFIAATMYATFYYIINAGNVSLMVSLINAFPVVTIFLAINFLHEWPNLYQWLGIVLVVLGTIFISISTEKADGKSAKNKKIWIFLGLFGALAIGIAEFVTKLATTHVDAFTFTFFVYLMYVPISIVFTAFDKKGRRFEIRRKRSSLIYTIIGIFFIEFGLIAIALAYQHGHASLVSPIVSSQMLVTAVLAVSFLKERLSTIQKIGILFTLIGVSVIGISS